MPRKLSSREWEFEVKRALKVRESQKERMRKQKFKFFEKVLNKALPLSILIGLTAITLIITIYGWREFFKFLLSWMVSLTLVATGAYYLWKSYEKEL